MVSVLEGQLTRTWYLTTETRKHTLSLYHDTITGMRSCTVDFDEVPGSTGNSSLFMESDGHRIFFEVGGQNGYFAIKRSGWTGFDYSCVVGGNLLTETTHEVAKYQDPIFKTSVVDTAFIPDEFSDDQIAWYRVVTERVTDKVKTSVHRRFKEFADLNSQIKQNFKGHHLRSSIPEFPEKTLKVLADHREPGFIQERRAKLDRYLSYLMAVPHVNDMTCVKAFLGLMDQVKEVSTVFHVPTLGLTLNPTQKPGTPCVVGSVLKPVPLQEGGTLGENDVLSKINGIPVSDQGFNNVVMRLKQLPRPLLVHFIQLLTNTQDKTVLTKVVVKDLKNNDIINFDNEEYGSGGNANVGASSGYLNNEVPNNSTMHNANTYVAEKKRFDTNVDPLAGLGATTTKTTPKSGKVLIKPISKSLLDELMEAPSNSTTTSTVKSSATKSSASKAKTPPPRKTPSPISNAFGDDKFDIPDDLKPKQASPIAVAQTPVVEPIQSENVETVEMPVEVESTPVSIQEPEPEPDMVKIPGLDDDNEQNEDNNISAAPGWDI